MSGMRPFSSLITVEEAISMIMEATVTVGEGETVALAEASGRVLSRDVVAKINVPGFRRSAMDGYAVIASETLGATRQAPSELQLAGRIYAGQRPDVTVTAGKCVQIATGAPMPEGADAVVIVEETSTSEDIIKIFKPVYSGANVSAADSDIAAGDLVLASGTLLNPAGVGALAALGFTHVEVLRRPRVMIFPTGEEIISPGGNPGVGQVFDINSYTLASLLREAGADVEIMPISGDTRDDLKAAMYSAKNADYAIFSGGSSVGERDYLASVISGSGEVIFHGIALKPGKPTVFGRVGGTLVFGMPGYPTSCLTNAYKLLLPSIAKKAGRRHIQSSGEHELGERVVSTIGRHHLYTVRLADGKAHPAFKESGAITSMSHASGWIEIPQNTEFLEKGTKVTVNYF